MIWLAPWALLGVIGVALPTLIHLLGRGHAQRRRFPSLRFLTASRLLPTQRTMIHDPWLLALRAAIVALAAIALARPLLVSAGRKRALDRGTARVTIVDSGRATPSARDSARAFVAGAQAGIVVESTEPRKALIGAVNWLAHEGRRSEIAIYSTFPEGTIDSLDLSVVPKSVGLRLIPVAGAKTDSVVQLSANGRVITAVARYDSAATTVQWTSGGTTTPAAAAIRLVVSPADSAALKALNAATSGVAIALPVDTSHIVAIVFPNAPQHARLDESASPVHSRWMVERIARLPADLQTTRSAEGSADGRPTLLFFPTSPASSLESARLVAAIARSASPSPVEGRGVEPIAPAMLARWSHPPSAADAELSYRPDDGHSDARWVWGAVIVLLVLEVWIRRARRGAAQADSEARARAA